MESPSTSTEAVKKATGKSLEQWFKILDGIAAEKLPHKEIAEKLKGEFGTSGWWAQMITVEYERKIGRRVVGQTSTGDFHATATKTVVGTMDDALRQWQQASDNKDSFGSIKITVKPRVSKTEKRRYWRTSLADGSKITVVIASKSHDKSLIAIDHESLQDQEAIKRWKAYWKGYLKGL